MTTNQPAREPRPGRPGGWKLPALQAGDMPPAVRNSLEVLEHHAQTHVCEEPYYPCPHETLCPCGGSVLLRCPECGEHLFFALAPGRPVCEHAAAYLRWARAKAG